MNRYDITIKELIEKYKKSLKIRNCAEWTISRYIRNLNRFFEYIEREHSITAISDITKETIYNYQIYKYEHINARGKLNTAGTQNDALKPVKGFFRFLKEHDYILSDPAAPICYAKKPKQLPRGILTKSEVKKILHAPDIKSVTGYRDRTLLEVLYSSGIRKAELTGLKLTDADYHDGLLRIEGKGNKDRFVPIGKIACRYLENYIKAVRPELIIDPYTNYIFLSCNGKPLSGHRIWEIVKQYAKAAKIKKNVYPHTFRHTCATAMLKNRADIRSIQELLGHSSLDSTQVYTRVTITDLKEVHKRCHPREHDKE